MGKYLDLWCKYMGHRFSHIYMIDCDEYWYQCRACGLSYIDKKYERSKIKTSKSESKQPKRE